MQENTPLEVPETPQALPQESLPEESPVTTEQAVATSDEVPAIAAPAATEPVTEAPVHTEPAEPVEAPELAAVPEAPLEEYHTEAHPLPAEEEEEDFTPHLEAVALAETATEAAAEDAENAELAAARHATEAQFTQTIASVLELEDEPFNEALTSATLLDMVLLVENVNRHELQRGYIRKVGRVKKAFDDIYAQTLRQQNDRLEEAESNGWEDRAQTAREDKARDADLAQRMGRALLKFQQKRNAYEEAQTAEREQNLTKKKALLEELKARVVAEDFAAIDVVRRVQNEWRQTGPVPALETENIQQSYRAFLTQFYALRERYNELIEQDRKVNQEEKERVLDELRGMTTELNADSTPRQWQEAADRVKALHDHWRNVGPAPREANEQLWERFKVELDAFYARRREFFDGLDSKRAEQNTKRQLILDRLKPFTEFTATTREGWMAASTDVQAIQEEWKALGVGMGEAAKLPTKLYRDYLNTFYHNREGYFESLTLQRAPFIQAKEALVEETVALSQEEFNPGLAGRYKDLQRRWRDTGPDDYKEARKLSRRFRKLCDTFFTQLKLQWADQDKRQQANLERKTAICQELTALAEDTADADQALEKAEALVAEWWALGHVPIAQKNEAQNQFRQAAEQAGRKLGRNLLRGPGTDAGRGGYDRGPRRDDRGSYDRGPRRDDRGPHSDRGGQDRGPRRDDRGPRRDDRGAPQELTGNEAEMRRIQGRLRTLEETIIQYENNMGFISKGKSGDKLRLEIGEHVRRAQEEQTRLKDELKRLKNPPKATPAAEPAAPAPEAALPETDAAVVHAPADATTAEEVPAPMPVAEAEAEPTPAPVAEPPAPESTEPTPE